MIDDSRSAARALDPAPRPPAPDVVEEELDRFLDQIQSRTDHHLGYPYNLDHDFSSLAHFLRYTLINLGDPFTDSNCRIDTRRFEREVLDFFAELFELPSAETAGYVTAGGTEGNIYGLYVAAQVHPDGVLYTSRDAHYSVFKACRMLRQPVEVIDSTPSGEIDYRSLERALDPSRPAIVNVNAGTTVKGAVDDPRRVLEALDTRGVERRYLHCDGALNGLMLPFISGAPPVDFSLPIDSLAISGHKFLGTPVPCGVVLLRREHQRAIESDVEYIGAKDTTILGARSGLAPLLMWYALRRKGREGLRRDVEACLRNARYLHGRLRALGWRSLLNPWSNTVWMDRPADRVVARWQLAVEAEAAHVVVMQNVDRAKIDEFLEDLCQSAAEVRP